MEPNLIKKKRYGEFAPGCRQLDHPGQIDFDNGKSAEFSDRVTLQTCYKVLHVQEVKSFSYTTKKLDKTFWWLVLNI